MQRICIWAIDVAYTLSMMVDLKGWNQSIISSAIPLDPPWVGGWGPESNKIKASGRDSNKISTLKMLKS